MRWNSQATLFAVLLLVYGVAGALYATLTPPWQAPDEPAHYNYIRYLAAEKAFPELIAACYNQGYLNELTTRRFPPELSITGVCYEFHQPPLYYLLASPVFWLTQGSVLGLRLLSVIWGAGAVILAFLIGRELFPLQPAIAFGTMAFVAFVPMHLAILASINNDALAEFILAALLFLLIRRLNSRTPSPFNDNLLLGLLLGAGLITKVTVYIAIPLVGIALWLAELQNSEVQRLQAIRTPESSEEPVPQGRVNWIRLIKNILVIYGLAFLIALPWYIRNITLYGGFDILGLGRHDRIVVGQLRTSSYLAEVGPLDYLVNLIGTTFRSFWGQFGWMAVPMDSRTYFFLTLLSLVAFTGFLIFIFRGLKPAEGGMNIALSPKHLTPTQTTFQNFNLSPETLSARHYYALSLLALVILLMALAYAWYNLTFVQFQGRYLFPSLIPLGIFFSLGLTEALSQRWAWGLSGLMALVLGWLLITSSQSGQFDKCALLITTLALLLVLGRAWLSGSRQHLSPLWLLVACYVGLALLALVAPFWFVIPYL